ncbi:MAG: hypothetical protein GEV11_17345, partial [Streptosporangiales bacterium]|nr:hypothetical protein [Streptosporangiales bacterium]
MEYRRLPTVLEDGAERLWQALNRMSVDPAPATTITHIARRAHSSGADLRRRQAALEEAERIGGVLKGLGNPDGVGPLLGAAATGGYWVALPDEGYEKYLGQLLDGKTAAGLLAKAADGDKQALRQLRKYTDSGRSGTDGFARGLMNTLGAKGTLQGAAEMHMRMLAMRDTAGGKQAMADRDQVLNMLCDSLAKVTDRGRDAYLGPGFTEDLKEQGRAEHQMSLPWQPALLGEYDGYWSLGQILRFADAETPFSAAFTGDVGKDMIDWDRDRPPASWLQIAPLDAFGDPPSLREADPLIGLMTAAGTGTAAAQGLFNDGRGKPPATLKYLVNGRWQRWNVSDRGDAFGKALAKAAAGQDTTSKLLAVQFTQVRADGINGFMQAKGKDWTVADRRKVDALSGLRDSTALILGNHLDD